MKFITIYIFFFSICFAQNGLEEYKKIRDEILKSALDSNAREFDSRALKIFEKLNFSPSSSSAQHLNAEWRKSNELVLSPVAINDEVSFLIRDSLVIINGIYANDKSHFDQKINIPRDLKYKKINIEYKDNSLIIYFLDQSKLPQ